MNIADNLRQAKTLIEDPARWCQGTNARDKHGRPTDAKGKDAIQWCAFGARLKLDAFPCPWFWRAASEICPDRSDVWLNDNTDHPTVMKMFDRAIKLAEEES